MPPLNSVSNSELVSQSLKATSESETEVSSNIMQGKVMFECMQDMTYIIKYEFWVQRYARKNTSKFT